MANVNDTDDRKTKLIRRIARTNLVRADHHLLSDAAYRLCLELADNRKSRPLCSGGLSLHRSITPNLDVSGGPGISHRLALGEIRWSD